jgi:hypothetical protein
VASAQGKPTLVRQADSALASGDLQRADSLYYLGPRIRSRDPQMREALGAYLAAQGRTKVGIVLIEEARLFGGDPAEIAMQLAPLYQRIGDWRALLTLPRSPLSVPERRRAAWLSEHPYEAVGDGGAASMVPTAVSGDTIARVAVKIAGRAAVAAIVGSDVGLIAGSRYEASARHFEGDSTIVAFDSLTIGTTKVLQVPASFGGGGSAIVMGAGALPATSLTINYTTGRVSLTRGDADRSGTRYPLFRQDGLFRVLDGKRWVSLAAVAASAQKAKSTLVIDPGAGEIRLRK